MLKMADMFAIGLVKLNKSKAFARDVIVLGCILLGVGDEESSPDVLDVEGREVTRNVIVIEQFF